MRGFDLTSAPFVGRVMVAAIAGLGLPLGICGLIQHLDMAVGEVGEWMGE